MRDAGVDVALLLGVHAGGGAGGDPAGRSGERGEALSSAGRTRPESFALGLFFSRENEGGGWGGLGAVDAGPRSRGRSPTSWVPLNSLREVFQHHAVLWSARRLCGGSGNQIVKI